MIFITRLNLFGLVPKQSGSLGSKLVSEVQIPQNYRLIWRYPDDVSYNPGYLKMESSLDTDNLSGLTVEKPMIQKIKRKNVSFGLLRPYPPAALIISAAGILSRVLGLLRDRYFGLHFLGAGDTLDVYYCRFSSP